MHEGATHQNIAASKWRTSTLLPWILILCLSIWLAEHQSQLQTRKLDGEPAASTSSTASQLHRELSSAHKRSRFEILPAETQFVRQEMDVLSERCIATMILGVVAFQMSLFYAVNHRDHDMKRYSLSVIGQTISIFCAVLTFSALFGTIRDYVHHAVLYKRLLMFPGLSIIFFAIMEIIVMIVVRIRPTAERPWKNAKSGTHTLRISQHMLNGKTFGAFTAQMCAAATIRGVGHLQFLVYVKYKSPNVVLVVSFLAFLALGLCISLCAWLRRVRILWDGVVDLTEEMWIKVAEECEDEVVSLSSGFLFAVYIRTAVTDSLPYMLLNGWQHRKSLEIAQPMQIMTLWAIGLACAALCIMLNVCFYGVLERGINEDKLRSNHKTRLLRVTALTLGMVFAWCTIFGAHLLSLQVDFLFEGLKLRLYLALFQSMASFAVILVLDFFADNAGPAYAKAIVIIIHCLGASVGLSWESAFHRCVEVCVEFMTEDQTLFKVTNDERFWSFLLSAVIVITVLPAFRFYIVPQMYHLMEEYEDKCHEQEVKFFEARSSDPQTQFRVGAYSSVWSFGSATSGVEDRFGVPKDEALAPMRSIQGGDRVRIKDLVSRADLNGRRGIVVHHDPIASRFEVSLEQACGGLEQEEVVRCRPENLDLTQR
jgi:hypothetical protein